MTKTFLSQEQTEKLFITAACAKTGESAQMIKEMICSGKIIRLKIKELRWNQGLEIHF
ncbi:MAG: hypothetical protein ACXAC7_21920 [Candidatus Hodarchaeales archaeon]|jgi:hypothetical protein